MILVGVVVVTVVVAVVAALLASNEQDDAAPPSAPVSVGGRADVGDIAPDFELPALDGDGTVKLSDFRGRPVVLNFWASYCHPCREEFPLFKEALQEHADDDLAIVGVAYQDIPSDSRRFVREEKADWPMAVDERGAVGKTDYGVGALPQTLFIDPRGRIVDRLLVGIPNERSLDHVLDRLLEKSR